MVINHKAWEDGHQTCDCLTYLRIGFDLANTSDIGNSQLLQLYFLFSAVLKEGYRVRAREL